MNITKSIKTNINEYQDDVFLLLNSFDFKDKGIMFSITVIEIDCETIDVKIESIIGDYGLTCRFKDSKFVLGYIDVYSHSETFDWQLDSFEEVTTKVTEVYKVYLEDVKQRQKLNEHFAKMFENTFR